jgi:hypothetical protein
LRKKTALRTEERSLKYDSSIFAKKIVKIVEYIHELKKVKKKNGSL